MRGTGPLHTLVRSGNLSTGSSVNMRWWQDDSLLGPKAVGGRFVSRAFLLVLPEV